MNRSPSRRWIAGRLLRSGLFAPRTLLALVVAAGRSGANLVALARLGGRVGGGAIVDGDERVAYATLADQAEGIAAALAIGHDMGRGAAIGIVGQNGLGFVRALLAVSRIGARAVLLNPALPGEQIGRLLERHGVKILLATGSMASPATGIVTVDPDTLTGADARPAIRLPRCSSGEIVVLTGGTTGLPKAAGRRIAPGGMIRLFLHLIAALRLERRCAVFVAVPLFHGFGLAALIVALALARTVHLQCGFDPEDAAALIARERIDTLVVVPTMLRRLLATGPLDALACVVSGGAALGAELASATRERLGDILFNLYGTSEAGLAVLATPDDLAASPDTIGRPVWGAQIMLRGPSGSGDDGELCVRSVASIARDGWIATGDLAHRDAADRLFVRGRKDDMIVSGGENVSPWELESVVATHSSVAGVAAVGVADRDHGQRLVAFVVPRPGTDIGAPALNAWLGGRVARHQMPRDLLIRAALPLTVIGTVALANKTARVAWAVMARNEVYAAAAA